MILMNKMTKLPNLFFNLHNSFYLQYRQLFIITIYVNKDEYYVHLQRSLHIYDTHNDIERNRKLARPKVGGKEVFIPLKIFENTLDYQPPSSNF